LKNLAILLFSILISFNSYGEWTEIAEGTRGNIYYIDTDTIKQEHGGYVYWRELVDLVKPDKDGDISVKIYSQGDCEVNRYKRLSLNWHKEAMGGGSARAYNPTEKWEYPLPNDASGILLDYVCSCLR
jgi:hypothetical protein